MRLHSLVATAWPATNPNPDLAAKRPALPLLGLSDQQYHVRQPGPNPTRAPLPWPCRFRQYASRWLIKDFHKALKTGLGPEKLQLQTAARLFAAVTLLSVVALVDLREKNRLQPNLPAEAAGLTATELRVLRHQSWRPVDTVCGPYTWPWPRWAGIWAAKATVRPADKPAGSAAGACSWKAFTWRRNYLMDKTQKEPA